MNTQTPLRITMKPAYCNTIIALACSLFACGAHGQTFTNPSPITIRDNLPAQPYPSTIAVSGVTGPWAPSP